MSGPRRDRSAILFGIVFIVIGLMFLADELGLWALDALYVLPILLIGLGLAVLLGATRRS